MKPLLLLALPVLSLAASASSNDAFVAQITTPPTLPLERRSEARVEIEKRQDDTPIPVDAPAGGLTLLTPAITAGVSYYKIAPSQSITFGWSLTDVIRTPTALTLKARSFLKNAFTYDIGPASGIDGRQTSYVWSPWEQWQNVPGNRQLVDSTYTLQIFDSRGPSVLPSAGLFAPEVGYQFAMYQPAAYTPLSEWTCPSCSPATRNRATYGTMVALVFGGVWLGWRAVRG
ncbi:hypothetical protein BT69DRAFT_1237539 [Atractiella rhizophila]|nr:hypothetical protein BT69DRAFT_1237539 [Atractiella rhizophila]